MAGTARMSTYKDKVLNQFMNGSTLKAKLGCQRMMVSHNFYLKWKQISTCQGMFKLGNVLVTKICLSYTS